MVTMSNARPPNDPPTAGPRETLLEAPAPAVVDKVLEGVPPATVVMPLREDGLGDVDVAPAEDEEVEGMTRK